MPSSIARRAAERDETNPRRTSSASRRRGFANVALELTFKLVVKLFEQPQPLSVIGSVPIFEGLPGALAQSGSRGVGRNGAVVG